MKVILPITILSFISIGLYMFMSSFSLSGAVLAPFFSFNFAVVLLLVFTNLTDFEDMMDQVPPQTAKDLMFNTAASIFLYSLPACFFVGVSLTFNKYYWGLFLICYSVLIAAYVYKKISAA